MPELIKELEYTVDLAGVADVGAGPFGQRLITNVTDGQFTGDRLTGTIVNPGADWLLVGPDGFGRLDTRLTFKTVDDALIYVQYFGLVEMTPGIMAILNGGQTPTKFGEQYFFIDPRMETGDARYSWVNQTVFIGQGRVRPGPQVDYRVFRLANC